MPTSFNVHEASSKAGCSLCYHLEVSLASVLHSPPTSAAELFCSPSVMFSCSSCHCTQLFRGRRATWYGEEDIQLGILKNPVLALFLPLAVLCTAK